jgi:hypothetical protein
MVREEAQQAATEERTLKLHLMLTLLIVSSCRLFWGSRIGAKKELFKLLAAHTQHIQQTLPTPLHDRLEP